MNFIPMLQATSGFGSFGVMIPMLLIFVIFYFLLIRPQKKEQKKTEQMISLLKKGDKIITIGGIHGVVNATKEKTIIIKVDDNCKMEINRTAVGVVLTEKKEAPDSKPVPDFAAEKRKKGFFTRKNKGSAEPDNSSKENN